MPPGAIEMGTTSDLPSSRRSGFELRVNRYWGLPEIGVPLLEGFL